MINHKLNLSSLITLSTGQNRVKVITHLTSTALVQLRHVIQIMATTSCQRAYGASPATSVRLWLTAARLTVGEQAARGPRVTACVGAVGRRMPQLQLKKTARWPPAVGFLVLIYEIYHTP